MLKQTMNPRHAIGTSISVSLELLAKVVPEPIFPFHRCLRPGNLLEVPCVDELPTEHQPDERRTAIRIEVPYEIRRRRIPKLRRRMKKYGGTRGDEKEIRMHACPTVETDHTKRRSRSRVGTTNSSFTSKQAQEKPAVEEVEERKGFAASSTPVWPVTRS